MRSLLLTPSEADQTADVDALCAADAVVLDLDQPGIETRCVRLTGRVPVYLRAKSGSLSEAGGLLEQLLSAGVRGVMVTDADDAASIDRAAAALRVAEALAGLEDGATPMLALLSGAERPLIAPHGRLAGLVWDAGRLAESLGLASLHDGSGQLSDAARLARVTVRLAAAAAGVPAIDAPYPLLADEAGLRAACALALADGFAGKAALCDSQAAIINAAFG